MSISLTVDHVERDGVGLGVRGGAGELAGVAQVRPRDPQRAHQPTPRATTVLRDLRQGGGRFNGIFGLWPFYPFVRHYRLYRVEQIKES